MEFNCFTKAVITRFAHCIKPNQANHIVGSLAVIIQVVYIMCGNCYYDRLKNLTRKQRQSNTLEKNCTVNWKIGI